MPLTEVWAYGFPNTKGKADIHKNLRLLDSFDPKRMPTGVQRKQSSFWQVHDALDIIAHTDHWPEGAFIVDGTGAEALKAAGSRFATGVAPPLPLGVEKSVVVFAYASGSYTPVLEHVVVQEGVIRVNYHYELRESADVRRHIAIIPVGDLSWSDGRIVVACQSIVDRDGQPAPVHHRIGQIMCQPADFTIPDD